MKKIYLFLIAVFSGAIVSNAQSISLTNNETSLLVANNATLYVSAPADIATSNHFVFKNISASTKSFMVKRTDIQLHSVTTGDEASAYFCTGINCYPPTTTLTPNAITLTANGTEDLTTYLQEATAEGLSTIKYEIYDLNNAGDKFTFYVSYNNPLSVKSVNSLFDNISDVYPNPAVSKAQITVSVKGNHSAIMSITNALGATVSVKQIDLYAGKNTIHLEAESLNSGIYFTTITSGNSKIIRKFTISK